MGRAAYSRGGRRADGPEHGYRSNKCANAGTEEITGRQMMRIGIAADHGGFELTRGMIFAFINEYWDMCFLNNYKEELCELKVLI